MILNSLDYHVDLITLKFNFFLEILLLVNLYWGMNLTSCKKNRRSSLFNILNANMKPKKFLIDTSGEAINNIFTFIFPFLR